MRGTMCKPGCIPMRAIIGALIFTSCLIAYMLRVNISINVIAMVAPQDLPSRVTDSGNGTGALEKFTAAPDYGPRYEWDSSTQGLILGSYFWGYIITSIPGGFVSERFGPARTITIVTIISGAVTILTPLCASWHYGLVIANRFILGLLGGVIYPALHCLISRWAPPAEKGKFIGALLGGSLGTVLTWPIMGAIIETWNWMWAFYAPGLLTLLWSLVWFFFVTDTPEEHKRITEDEKLYIAKCIGNGISKKKTVPPYMSMFLSVPFWALTVLHFGNLWGLYFLLTAGPKFMSEVLGYDLGHSGILAALPNLARMIVGFIIGSLGDVIRARNWIEITTTRKIFVVFSHIIPGIFVFAQTLIGFNPTLAVALMTFALGFNGASTLTNLQNAQDLSPNFAGTIYGIVNCIGGTTGFINPIITSAFITTNNSSANEWYIIFYIGSAVYIGCGIFFFIFGTGTTQPWNNVSEDVVNAETVVSNGITNEAFQSDNFKEENTKV